MFGRNTNALPNTNPIFQHPQNHGIGLSTYAYLLTTFFNFQFPNQTINNNFPAQQQQFFINYYQQPFQQQPTYNQNNAAPDLYQYLQESNEFSGKSIAESSKSKYESNMRVYESVTEIFKRQPYPIDIDKMKVFFFTYVEVLHLV